MNEFFTMYLPWAIIAVGLITFALYYKKGTDKKNDCKSNQKKLYKNNEDTERYKSKLFDFEEVKGYSDRRAYAYKKWEKEKNDLKSNKPFSSIFVMCPLFGCFIGIILSVSFDFEISYGIMYGLLIGICAGTFILRKK